MKSKQAGTSKPGAVGLIHNWVIVADLQTQSWACRFSFQASYFHVSMWRGVQCLCVCMSSCVCVFLVFVCPCFNVWVCNMCLCFNVWVCGCVCVCVSMCFFAVLGSFLSKNSFYFSGHNWILSIWQPLFVRSLCLCFKICVFVCCCSLNLI